MHASNDVLVNSEPNLRNDSPLSPLSPHSQSRVTPINLPKNRSAGNLYTRRGNAPDRARVRFSLDASAPEFYSFSMSPVMTEHDHGLSMPGLRRARLHPPHRIPTLPPSLSSSVHSGAPQQSTHLTVSLPPSRAPSFSMAPPSPSLNYSEVLTHSPTESLHAFSFVQQSEEAIHSPQNALKLSVDFLRDKMGWEATTPGNATAQTKANGDYGVHSMTELFNKADLVQEGIETDFRYPSAPLTCPAQITEDNVFDRSFWPISPLLSRPGTPPHQSTPENTDSEESEVEGQPISLLAKELKEAASEPIANGASEPKQTIKRANSIVEPVSEEKTKTPRKKSISAQDAEVPKKKTIAEFTILEEMGQGAYGQVKLARYKKSGDKVVLKYVTKRRILVDTWTRDRRLGTVPLEIHVLDYLRRDGLKHLNILEMSDFFEDDINYYIEMVPHGLPGMDLFDYIELRVNMEEEECRSIFVQVADAIHHLHTKALVVHRDIKDENVVLNSEGKVKLIDFGSAAYLKNGPFEVFVGTIDYAAPEVLAGRPYRGKEQDVWALGILLYTIIYKENPFYSIEEITDHDLRVPYIMSPESIELVRLMLERDVEKRITIEQILEHPWYKAHTPS